MKPTFNDMVEIVKDAVFANVQEMNDGEGISVGMIVPKVMKQFSIERSEALSVSYEAFRQLVNSGMVSSI